MRRREFLASASAIAASALMPRLSAAPQDKTNVLMIPFDDLKPLMGCYGVKEILTPNMDRLAARGTVFLNNCCQQAVCGPTRASLMTGMYPDTTGVWDLKTRMRDVNPDILSMPQYFRQQGYETTGLGKTYDPRCVDKKLDEPSWSIPYGTAKYLFNQKAPRPMWGYQNAETRAAKKKGNALIKGQKFSSGSARNRALTKVAGSMVAPATECADVPDDAYPDGALVKGGCVMLERLAKGDKPFFLSVGFLKPHLPFVAPRKYWDLYDPAEIKIHPFQKHSKDGVDIAYHNSGELRSYSDIPLKGDLPPEMQIRLIHGYRACVSYVDAQLGILLDKLEELGLADKTIVCLWGDHGWHLGDHAMWCKHSNFEQAARAPLIISAPGQPKGTKTMSPTGFVDIFPTLCELASLPIPTQLQGKSIVKLMSDPKASVRKAIMSQYPRSIDGQPAMGYTLRDERYRYVKWLQMNFRGGARKGLLIGAELYDYQTDPNETVNQAENPKFAAIVQRFEDIFAEMGVAQHTGKFVAIQDVPVVNGVGGVLLNGAGNYVTLKPVKVTGQPFDQAHETTVTRKPDKTSAAAYKRPVMIELKKGKTYRLSFWCRSDEGAEFNAIFQRNGAPYDRVDSEKVTAGKDWQKVELVGEAKDDFEPSGTVLTCHLGQKLQTVQFADVRAEEVE
jgi:arylsulfatase A-like enzyme